MTPTPRSASDHFPQLDGLRCVAVLLVVWSHTAPRAWTVIGEFSTGEYGVRLFFVLSAFLITGILLRLRDRMSALGPALGTFYARRFLRILPAYYAVLAAVLVVIRPRVGFADVLAHASYLSNWWLIEHGSHWFGHFWTLAVEEQFYLVWPLLILCTRPTRLPRYLGVAIAIGLVSRTAILAFGGSGLVMQYATPSCFDAFGIGALLAWHIHEFPVATAIRRRWLDIGLVAGVVAVLAPIGLRASHAAALANVQTLGAALTAAWLVERAAVDISSSGGRLLASRTVVYVGSISYGIYLIHVPVRWTMTALTDGVGPFGEGTPLFLFVTVVSLVLASVSWRVLEAPINGLKRHFPYEAERRQRVRRYDRNGRVPEKRPNASVGQ